MDEASTQKAIPLIMKDVSWLWRTAYNCAIQGCSEWEDCEEQIWTLFNIARDVCCSYLVPMHLLIRPDGRSLL